VCPLEKPGGDLKMNPERATRVVRMQGVSLAVFQMLAREEQDFTRRTEANSAKLEGRTYSAVFPGTVAAT
jgi:hypothetical protein